MNPVRLASLAFALAFLVPAFAAPGTQAADPTTTTETLYLHSLAPTDKPEETLAFGGVAPGPAMDTTPPLTPAPKIAQGTPVANPDYAGNFLAMFWQAPMRAQLLGARMTIFVDVPSGSAADATLFADGTKVARMSLPVTDPTAAVVLDFGALNAPVGKTLLLQIESGTQANVFYDSTLMPSSLTVTLGPYVAPVVGGGSDLPRTPATGWGNVQLAGVTALGREASLAINPANEQQMFMCAPTGVPDTTDGHSFFSMTNDGGAHWGSVQVETSTTDTRKYAFEGGDCDVAFDQGGTMYTADTWLGDLSVGHSTDGGQTWSGTAFATTAPVVDRPWLVGGPAGTLYLTWQDVQFGMPTAIWFSKSTDYGTTFLPAVPVAVSHAPQVFSWEGNPVVAPGGHDLYLVYTTRAQALVGVNATPLNGESVYVAASHDDGLTWTSTLVTKVTTSASYLYPSIGLDGAGGLHVVYSSATSTDQPTFYAYSGDQGATWSTPVKVGGGGYHSTSPWIVGGPHKGEAALEFYATKEAKGNASAYFDWFLGAYRVTGADVGTPTFAGGWTTTTPIYSGNQTMPEFNQIRLDSQDRMHIGAAAYLDQNGATNWGLWQQTELAGGV